MHRNHALHDFAPQLSGFFSPFSLVPSPGRKILRTSSVNKKSQGQFSLSLTQIVFDNMSQCLKPGVSSLFTHIPAEQSCLMASFLSFCANNKAGDSGRALILIYSYHHRKSTVYQVTHSITALHTGSKGNNKRKPPDENRRGFQNGAGSSDHASAFQIGRASCRERV